MANTYTDKLKLRKPAEGDGSWADEMQSNAQILEVVQAAILEDNYVVSGLVTSTAAGLVADYTAGVVVISGTQYSVGSGSKTVADNTDGTNAPNFLYVDSSGVMRISTTPPTGEYAPIALVDTLSGTITRVGDLRPQKTSKVAETSATGSALIPAGTTAQRDTSPVFGATRANSTTGQMEWWNNTTWVGLATFASTYSTTQKAIFGYGNTGSSVSMTNLVNNLGVVATDTTGVGTARYYLAAAGYSLT